MFGAGVDPPIVLNDLLRTAVRVAARDNFVFDTVANMCVLSSLRRFVPLPSNSRAKLAYLTA